MMIRAQGRAGAVGLRLCWLGYAALVAMLIVVYATMLATGHALGIGVDYACFRAASLMMMHGANPYNVAHLWAVENALYNVPLHLPPGAAPYYRFDRYVNPPLFAWVLGPLARLPFAQGYAVYALLCVALAALGAWLVVTALGWTARRSLAAGIAVVCPYVFLTAWYGQQSTLLLCAFGAALYALRRERPALAGACLAVGWVKPHLLVPVALTVPLLLSPRAALRCYGGFGMATLCGVLLTGMTSGFGSITLWLHTLLGYTGEIRAVQSYLPSLSGMAWILLPQTWSKAVTPALTGLGLVAMLFVAMRARRAGLTPVAGASIMAACWLLFTPFVHAHDDILLLPALAVAWGRDTSTSPRLLPSLALWAVSTVSLSFLLPEPWKLLGAAPPLLVVVAALARRPWPALSEQAHSGQVHAGQVHPRQVQPT